MKPAKQAVLKHMVPRDFIVQTLKGIVVHETSSVLAGILEKSMIYIIHSALYLKENFNMWVTFVVIWSGRSTGMIHFQA